MARNKSVCAGASYLDEHVPGWERMIDLDTLDLATGESCVLAQIYLAENPRTRARYRAYVNKASELGLSEAGAAKLGFLQRRSGQSWWNLRAAWIAAIQERLA